MRQEHIDRWLVAVLLLANFGLKVAWAGVNELAGDEPFTVYWALRPLTALFDMLRTENNPPLYFLVMHWWSGTVPLETAWLRVPSAVFSALTVWPLFLLGKRIGGRAVALTAALLFTFSDHHYGFAHEVRGYPLLVLACTWAVLQLVRLADGGRRSPSIQTYSILWLVLANILAVWTHYFGWLMVGLELLLVFVVPSLRPMRVKMLITAAITAVSFIPWSAVLFSRAGSSLAQGTWVTAPAWDEPYSVVVRWSNAPVVAVVFLALIVLAMARGRILARSIPFLWCMVPLIGLFLVSSIVPVYIDRYLLFASMGFYLLVAQAAAVILEGRWLRVAATGGSVAAMAFTFTPWKDSGAHPSKVVAQVEQWKSGKTAIIIQPGWYDLAYAWALDPALLRGPAPLDLALAEKGIHPLLGAPLPVLDSAVATVVHVDAWASLTDPGHQVLHELRTSWLQVDSVEADRKVIVRRFIRTHT